MKAFKGRPLNHKCLIVHIFYGVLWYSLNLLRSERIRGVLFTNIAEASVTIRAKRRKFYKYISKYILEDLVCEPVLFSFAPSRELLGNLKIWRQIGIGKFYDLRFCIKKIQSKWEENGLLWILGGKLQDLLNWFFSKRMGNLEIWFHRLIENFSGYNFVIMKELRKGKYIFFYISRKIIRSIGSKVFLLARRLKYVSRIRILPPIH